MRWTCKLEPVIKKGQRQEWEGITMLGSRQKNSYMEIMRKAQKTRHLYILSLRGKAEV